MWTLRLCSLFAFLLILERTTILFIGIVKIESNKCLLYYNAMKKRRASSISGLLVGGAHTIRISHWTIANLICWLYFIGCHNSAQSLVFIAPITSFFLIFTQSISLRTVQLRYLIPKHSPDILIKPHKSVLSPRHRTFSIQILRKQQPHTNCSHWIQLAILQTIVYALDLFFFYCSEIYFRCAHLQKQDRKQ